MFGGGGGLLWTTGRTTSQSEKQNRSLQQQGATKKQGNSSTYISWADVESGPVWILLLVWLCRTPGVRTGECRRGRELWIRNPGWTAGLQSGPEPRWNGGNLWPIAWLIQRHCLPAVTPTCFDYGCFRTPLYSTETSKFICLRNRKTTAHV